MARTPKDVTETELAILKMLWERSDATTRELTDALYPDGTAAQYATVQKLLERLEVKGFVIRDRSRHVHTFRPAVRRDDLIHRRLRSLAESLCDGALGALLTALVRSRKLSDAERRELREILEATKEPTPPVDGKKKKR